MENQLMAQYECLHCNKNLHGHPKIKVEGDIYCYFCAKELVAALDRPAEIKQANDFKIYEAQEAQLKSWENSRKLASPSGATQKLIIVGVAIGCAVLMEHPVFFVLPGLLVGFVVLHFYYDSQKKDWIRKNPQPVSPSLPSIDFVRHSIELVGGVSGTPLSSSVYRETILERDGYQCQICGEGFPDDQLEVHHVKPQAKRGKHYPANLVTLCYRCHVDEIWFGHKHKMRPRHR